MFLRHPNIKDLRILRIYSKSIETKYYYGPHSSKVCNVLCFGNHTSGSSSCDAVIMYSNAWTCRKLFVTEGILYRTHLYGENHITMGDSKNRVCFNTQSPLLPKI